MKILSKIIAVMTIMIFLLVPTQSAQAQDSTEPGKVVFGDSFTLESGKTLEGDLVVFGGNVTIETDAVVTGSVVVFGGTIELEENATIQQDTAMIGGTMEANGVVNGDLFVMGGRIVLNETAVIHGDISTMGGEIERDENAQVDGEIVENAPAPAVQVPTVPVVPGVPDVPGVPAITVEPVIVRTNPLGQVGRLLGFSLVIAAFGMFLSLFLQPQFDRVSSSIMRQPLVAGSFGLLTVALTPFVVLILAVTVVLLPVAFLAMVAVSLAWLFGVIALGQEVGERFTKAVNQTWPPVLTVGFGTFFLMLISSSFLVLDGIPGLNCIAWIMLFLVGLVGIGGVAMTWFGTRLAPGTQATAAQPPVEVPPAS